MATFFLKSGVNDIVAAIQEYQAHLLNNLKDQLQTIFNRHSGSELHQEALGLFNNFRDPFAAVSTTYRQDNPIKENFSFVEAEEVSVGLAVCHQKGQNKRPHNKKTSVSIYIPIKS